MYVEGTMDLMGMILMSPFSPPEQKEKQLAAIIEKATTRYFPVYEKVGHHDLFLLANERERERGEQGTHNIIVILMKVLKDY